MATTFETIYQIVRQIPRGKVAYYGQIARFVGMPGGARIVGYAMESCPMGSGVPCHRVVDKQGGTKAVFDTFAPNIQQMLLEQEGVVFLSDGRVDMARCLWDGHL